MLARDLSRLPVSSPTPMTRRKRAGKLSGLFFIASANLVPCASESVISEISAFNFGEITTPVAIYSTSIMGITEPRRRAEVLVNLARYM